MSTGHAPLFEIKEFQLGIFELPALLFNVVLNGFPVSAVAHRADVIAVRPELSSPELRLDPGELEAGLSSERFDPPDDLSARIFWQELTENVHVILIESHVVNVDGKPLLESLEHLENRVDDLRLKNHMPILDRELNVVVALRDIVIPTPEVGVEVDHGTALYLFVVCVGRIRCLRAPSWALAQGM